ncbi:hypothetical protein GUITHDRAFT_113348 [Guillardia theta CCMP2712]|uniref:STI1 domain-containing protein n=1 Tax=Guillardia theta (strain CCMP2712) TaxID=905079 RepID=L1IWR8_GUITC|nr:hypothetical protein GUITHDRAFT_113348 [Guillardia theta CCMP2712]EKX40562.1 hypothetical protein GUITHDRAFT_113348 [Guillardia theta CCMP2712]|eukprot:XP_005827542.1 hypothetical protein GUITHDRAFT_113348 [Guillardia theta CCMP2712]
MGRAKEAMKDPSIQQIMSDPVMRQASDHLRVLDDMQSNPTSAAKHMQDPMVKRNIDLLVAAGIIQMR